MSDLKIGDQVIVESIPASGTVIGIDTHPRPGVEVRLHRPVHGAETCYATHKECRKITRDQPTLGGDE